MSEGLKRSMRYVVNDQLESIAVATFVSLIYSMAMMLFLSTGNIQSRLESGLFYFDLMIFIFLFAFQATNLKGRVLVQLSFGATRKSIATGNQVANLFQFVGISAIVVLINSLCQTKIAVTSLFILDIMGLVLLMIAIGILAGYVIVTFPRAGGWIIVGMIVVVAVSAALIIIKTKEGLGLDSLSLLFAQPSITAGLWISAIVLYAISSFLSIYSIKKAEL